MPPEVFEEVDLAVEHMTLVFVSLEDAGGVLRMLVGLVGLERRE
jgi:hypothetical protein